MLTFEEHDDELICRFEGALNTSACWELEQQLIERIAQTDHKVVFDMSKVEYVASAFLRICLAVTKQRGVDKIRLNNLPPEVLQAYQSTGLDQTLNIEVPDEE